MKKFLPSAPQAVQGIIVALLAIAAVNKIPALRKIVGPGA